MIAVSLLADVHPHLTAGLSPMQLRTYLANSWVNIIKTTLKVK